MIKKMKHFKLLAELLMKIYKMKTIRKGLRKSMLWIVVTLTGLSLWFMTFVPTSPYIDEALEQLVIPFVLGPAIKLDYNAIVKEPVPDNIFDSLIRTFGLSVMSINSGRFYNKQLDCKIRIYANTKDSLAYLRYYGEVFITNDWE